MRPVNRCGYIRAISDCEYIKYLKYILNIFCSTPPFFRVGVGRRGRVSIAWRAKDSLKFFPMLKDKHGDIKDICSTFSFRLGELGGGGGGWGGGVGGGGGGEGKGQFDCLPLLKPLHCPSCKHFRAERWTDAPANSRFSPSCNASTFNAMCFDQNPFICRVRKRKQKGLLFYQISRFS